MALFIKHTPNSLQTDSISACLPNKRRQNAIFDRETILKQSEQDLKAKAATSSFPPLFSLVERKKLPWRSQSPDIKATLRGNLSWPPSLVPMFQWPWQGSLGGAGDVFRCIRVHARDKYVHVCKAPAVSSTVYLMKSLWAGRYGPSLTFRYIYPEYLNIDAESISFPQRKQAVQRQSKW